MIHYTSMMETHTGPSPKPSLAGKHRIEHRDFQLSVVREETGGRGDFRGEFEDLPSPCLGSQERLLKGGEARDFKKKQTQHQYCQSQGWDREQSTRLKQKRGNSRSFRGVVRVGAWKNKQELQKERKTNLAERTA